MPSSFECPICTYNGLKRDPHEGDHEICPSCGTHFGYVDCGPERKEFYWGMLRERYIVGGCKWYSGFKPRPENFDPMENIWGKIREHNKTE